MFLCNIFLLMPLKEFKNTIQIFEEAYSLPVWFLVTKMSDRKNWWEEWFILLMGQERQSIMVQKVWNNQLQVLGACRSWLSRVCQSESREQTGSPAGYKPQSPFFILPVTRFLHWGFTSQRGFTASPNGTAIWGPSVQTQESEGISGQTIAWRCCLSSSSDVSWQQHRFLMGWEHIPQAQCSSGKL